jgi:hypothetical protein
VLRIYISIKNRSPSVAFYKQKIILRSRISVTTDALSLSKEQFPESIK